MLTSNDANTATHPDTFASGSISAFGAGGATVGSGGVSVGSASRGVLSCSTVLLTLPESCGQYDASAAITTSAAATAATRGSHAFMRGAYDTRGARIACLSSVSSVSSVSTGA